MKNVTFVFLLALLLLATTAHAASDWTEKYPDPHPSERYGHEMAYIGEDQVLLFGGEDSTGFSDETWIYDVSESTWTQRYPASSPSKRYYTAMSHIGGDQVLLFGGQDSTGLSDETWVYDLSENTWTLMSPAAHPSARSYHALALIEIDQVLLFGGQDSTGLSDETWIYDLSENTWTLMGPAAHPSARSRHGMAYLPEDQVLLFGGDDGSRDNETWVYDLSEDAWTQRSPSHKPSARTLHAMAYLELDQVLLHGGWTTGNRYDTWIYDLSDDNWIEGSYSPKPGSRSSHGMSETSYDGTSFIVLFGGSRTGGDSDETWTFGGNEHLIGRPSVTVASPNGGEVMGDSTTITWAAVDPDPAETALLAVDLDYSDDAGSNWTAIDSNQTNDGSYWWDLSGLPDSDNYLVRVIVTDTTGLSDADTSDAAFTIYNPDPPQVTLTYPNGGEVLTDTTIIAWTATDPDPGESALLLVDIDYSADAGSTWAVIDSNQANDGEFHWDVATVPDDNKYLIRVTVTDTTGFDDVDTSDGVFAIDYPYPPQVTVIYPNGDETLVDTVTITWTATDPDPGEAGLLSVDLDYSPNDGASWTAIDSNRTNSGTYLWDISELPYNTEYLVRITATDTNGVSGADTSDDVFTVIPIDAAEDWTERFPDPHPSSRERLAMAYINGDELLLFGGETDSGFSAETWVYDFSANTWTEQFPATSPSARRYHAMAYVGGDQVVLFGGEDSTGLSAETWVYDLSGSDWTLKSLSTVPSARDRHDMAYLGGDQVLLFGGDDGSYDDETWVYDLSANTWTQMSPASKPSARRDHALAHAGGDRALLFGGSSGAYNNETWVYDLGANTWTQMNSATRPSARSRHNMAYLGGDQVMMFSGAALQGGDETWVYDLGDDQWTQDYNAIKPFRREDFGLCETSMLVASCPVLFGGSYGGSETWVFGGGEYFIPDPPQVTVISPNGGEAFTDSMRIFWMATDPDPGDSASLIIDLEFSGNAGGSWAVIDSNQANTGSYLWDISGLPDSDSCLIRLTATDTTDRSDSDLSDAVFTVYNLHFPQVTIIHPNGGEALRDSAVITWTATDQNAGETELLLVDLDYSDDAGTTWTAIDSNQANDSSYTWNISDLRGGADYLVRITAMDTMGLADSDTSDALFSIDYPQPYIVSISDVSSDQGQQVAVLWDRSYYDDSLYQVITYYSIKRKYPAGAKSSLVEAARSRSASRNSRRSSANRVMRREIIGDDGKDFWEHMGDVVAHYNEGYAFIAPTLWDSSGSDPGYFTFKVTAHTADPGTFYESAPDSGYSVDDIDPAKTQVTVMPGGESKWALAEDAAKSSGNTVRLIWEEVITGEDGSPESGPVSYRVYYGTKLDIAPELGNLLTTTSGLSYAHIDARIGDPAVNLYYLVTTVDGSGNESAASNVVGEFDRGLSSVK